MFSILQEDYVKSTVRLTLRADPPIIILQRVSVQMRVKESLGILVLESDRIKVSQLCGPTPYATVNPGRHPSHHFARPMAHLDC